MTTARHSQQGRGRSVTSRTPATPSSSRTLFKFANLALLCTFAMTCLLPTAHAAESKVIPNSIKNQNDWKKASSDYAAIWHIISPVTTTSSCYDTPDTCFTDIHAKDEDWLKKMPWSCPDNYEEAGSYIANEGIDVRLEGNDLAREAVNQLRGLPFGRISTNDQDHCSDEKPFRFIKFRVCVPEGSSCLPNGKFDINTDVYYNLFTHDHKDGTQLLGAGKGASKEYTVKGEEYCLPPGPTTPPPLYPSPCTSIPITVKYNEGGLMPGKEIVFNSKSDAGKEPNQWRFERISSNRFHLINRWTGQYLGSKSVSRKGATDTVGSSVLEKDKALTVSLSQTCSGAGAITLSGPSNGQTFKKGREGTLYLTAAVPPPKRVDYKGCYYAGVEPDCPKGSTNKYSGWCDWGGVTRWCETPEWLPKTEGKHKDALQFHLREVVKHVSPENTYGRDASEKIESVNSSKDTSASAIESFVFNFLWENSEDLKEIFYPSEEPVEEPSPSPNPPSSSPQQPSRPPRGQKRRPTTTRRRRLKSSYKPLRRSNAISDLSELMGKPLKGSKAIAKNLGDVMQLEDANKIFRRQNAMYLTESASSAVSSISMPKLKSSGKAIAGLMSSIGTIAGPALSIGFIFVSAYFDYLEKQQTAQRFQNIENAIKELADYIDDKIEKLWKELKEEKYGSINTETVGAYNDLVWVDTFRQLAMENFDYLRSRAATDSYTRSNGISVMSQSNYEIYRGKLENRADKFNEKWPNFHPKEVSGMEDIIMTFFPMFAVTYMTMVQEYGNLHAIASILYPPRENELPPSSCAEFLENYIKKMEKMAEYLKKYRKTVMDKRKEKIAIFSNSTMMFLKDGDKENVLCHYGRSNNYGMLQKVQTAKRNEVEWAFDHFGKYDLSTIGSLIVALRNGGEKIVKTCKRMKADEVFRNDYIDLGLITSKENMPANDITCPAGDLPIAHAQVDFSNPNAPSNSLYTLTDKNLIVEPAPGNVPRALRINGNGQYATLPGVDISPSKMKHCTLVMGVYLETIANDFGYAAAHDNGDFDRAIVLHDKRGSGMILTQGSAGRVYPNYNPAPTQKWIQVIAIYRQGGTCEFWFDGTKAPLTLTGNNSDGLPDLYIGSARGYDDHQIDGWIKEIQVFDRALNPLEVGRLYNNFRNEMDGGADALGFGDEL